MKKLLLIVFVIELLISSFSPEIIAGGIITIEENRRNKSIINTTYIEKHMMRIESKMGNEMFIAIFNAEKEILYNIDMAKKTYVIITKADLENVGNKIVDINKILDEKMKELPKEQQEMMKNMLKQNMPEKIDIKKDKTYSLISNNEKIENWDCDKYRVKEEDILIKDVWVADWKKSGLKDDYKNVLKSFENFFHYFTDQLGDKVKSQSLNLDFSLADKGIPIKTVYYTNGKENAYSIVKEIKEEALPITLFLVPNDFLKTDPFAQFNSSK